VHAVLLAAGSASRFGSAKQRALVGGVSLVRRAALAGIEAGVGMIVVTGAHADAVVQELKGLPIRVVHNAAWEQGMGNSIACGIRAASEDPSTLAALICLVDQPQVGAVQLRQMIDVHRRSPQRIVAADHGAALGPPCLFPRRFFAELAALSGAQGARRVLQAHPGEVERVAMPEAAIDLDTPEDYARFTGGDGNGSA
jgi:molybdenum cofactor cytidylyltransferase